jgi:hypothetical protein
MGRVQNCSGKSWSQCWLGRWACFEGHPEVLDTQQGSHRVGDHWPLCSCGHLFVTFQENVKNPVQLLSCDLKN